MTILFAGGEMGAFIPSDSNVLEGTGTPGYFDSAFARCYLQPAGSASYADSPEFTETDDIWIHLENISVGATNSSTQVATITLLDGSDAEVFRLLSSTPYAALSQTWQLQYNNASVWTNLGSSFTVTNVLSTIDIHLVANSASGSGKVYVSGTQRSSGTADLSAIAGVAKIRLNGKTTSIPATCRFSQVIVADESTIGWRLITVPATGAGATNDMIGGYTEIDEIVYSDADFINSATANQVELFSHSTAIPAGYSVRGFAVTARAKCGTGGPQNLQLALRSGGTTYFSSTKALDAGYGAFFAVWEDDPATTADFTTSAVALAQFGVKSIA
jgi:hypothetical protein